MKYFTFDYNEHVYDSLYLSKITFEYDIHSDYFATKSIENYNKYEYLRCFCNWIYDATYINDDNNNGDNGEYNEDRDSGEEILSSVDVRGHMMITGSIVDDNSLKHVEDNYSNMIKTCNNYLFLFIIKFTSSIAHTITKNDGNITNNDIQGLISSIKHENSQLRNEKLLNLFPFNTLSNLSHISEVKNYSIDKCENICDQTTSQKNQKKYKKLIDQFITMNEKNTFKKLKTPMVELGIECFGRPSVQRKSRVECVMYANDNCDKYIVAYQNVENLKKLFSLNLSCIGLFDLTNNTYITLGEDSCHPYILADSLNYGNSDGSGPHKNVIMKTSTDILNLMNELFCKFSDNSYH
jgi:hypothetical protein